MYLHQAVTSESTGTGRCLQLHTLEGNSARQPDLEKSGQLSPQRTLNQAWRFESDPAGQQECKSSVRGTSRKLNAAKQ